MNATKKIILLSGKAGSGKDFFYNSLQEFYKEGFGGTKRYAFADQLKEFCTNVFDWDGKKDEEGRQLLITVGTYIFRGYWNFTENGIYDTAKKLIDNVQYKSKDKLDFKEKSYAVLNKIDKFYGYKDYTVLDLYNKCYEYITKPDKNYWINIVKKKIIEDFEEYDLFVITDCRFKNEIKQMKKFFEDKCEVVNLRIVNNGVDGINDISETELDNESFDYVIENDYVYDNFRNKVKDFLKLLL